MQVGRAAASGQGEQGRPQRLAALFLVAALACGNVGTGHAVTVPDLYSVTVTANSCERARTCNVLTAQRHNLSGICVLCTTASARAPPKPLFSSRKNRPFGTFSRVSRWVVRVKQAFYDAYRLLPSASPDIRRSNIQAHPPVRKR